MANFGAFAAHAPNRWLYTTGQANGEFPLIRMTGAETLTGVDGVADPIDPVVAHGRAPIIQNWATSKAVG